MLHKANILIVIAIGCLVFTLVVTPRAVTVAERGRERLQAPSPATTIEPGIDLYTTPCGGASYWDFLSVGNFLLLRSGFFGSDSGRESDEFIGRIEFGGRPLSMVDPEAFPPSTYGTTDTIVRRKESASLPGTSDSATVEIEVVALSLVSCHPIRVTYNDGSSEMWNVAVSLPSPGFGGMTIRNACDFSHGGTFDAQFSMVPKLVFTRIDAPGVDPPVEREINLSLMKAAFNGHWLPSDPGFGLITVPDESSGNFFPGIWNLPCILGDCHAFISLRRTTEFNGDSAFSGVTAYHAVLPAAQSPDCDGDGTPDDADSDGFTDDADNCPLVSNPLQEDSDRDGKGDVCDRRPDRYDPCTRAVGPPARCPLPTASTGSPHGLLTYRIERP